MYMMSAIYIYLFKCPFVPGRPPNPRRASTLPALPARPEDLQDVPLLHRDGDHDRSRLLALLHHDLSRLHVPLVPL